MSPELEWLVMAASGAAAPRERPIDWERLAALGEAHGLSALLWRRLGSRNGDVPADAAELLRASGMAAEWRQKLLSCEQRSLCGLLDAERVPVLCFKGPSLAALAWEEGELRGSTDLDLLVRREDALRAARLLEAHAYRRVRPAPGLQAKLEAQHLHRWNEFEFISEDGLVSVDLHWAVTPPNYPFRLDLGPAWASPLELEESGLHTLPLETLVVALCVHGSKHLWSRLVWVCDIDRLARRFPTLDWDRVQEIAQRSRAERALLLGAAVSEKLLGSPMPRNLSDRVRRDTAIPSLLDQVASSMETAGLQQTVLSEAANLKREVLPVFDSRGDALGYVWRTLMTPKWEDWERLSLPESQTWLYRVLRPLLVASDAARLMARRAASSRP
jgi:hypothetical protein